MSTPVTPQATSKTKLFFYVALVVLIWSTGYPLVYYVIYAKGFPAEWMPAARTALPALAITFYVYLRGLKLPPLTDKRWVWYGLMGFLGMTAPFYLLPKGYEFGIESGMSSILVNGAMPLFTIILAHFLVKSEPLNWRTTIGFFIGSIGIIFLFLPEELSWKFISNWEGQGFMLLVALSYAFAAIVAKRSPDTDPNIGAAIMLITAAVTALAIAVPAGLPTSTFPSTVIIALFVLSIVYTGLSDILYLKVIKLSGPSMIGKINYLVPVVTVSIGVLFLGEAFSWRSVAAMMIVITGLLIARVGESG